MSASGNVRASLALVQENEALRRMIARALKQLDVSDAYAKEGRLPGDGTPSIWEIQNSLLRGILNPST